MVYNFKMRAISWNGVASPFLKTIIKQKHPVVPEGKFHLKVDKNQATNYASK